MKSPVKTPEEISDVLESAAPAQRRLEVEKATETELPSGELEKAGGQISASRKRMLGGFVVTLIIVGIAGAGYMQRERLLDLIRSRDVGQSSTTGGQARRVLYWVDPMHPAYKSDKPGKAPDCGMDLVPVYENGAGQLAVDLPDGVFRISPEKQQLIGVQYGEADYKAVSKTLRAVGRLTYDETKMARIHTKIDGWIEQVYVDFTGKLVKKGQPLISIYSPELLQTQQEFLLARRGRDELAESPFREAVNASESLFQAARKRLELWDISEAQIDELEKSGRPTKTLTLFAPADGFVLTRNAFAKQRVTPETELYAIADLSTIWVIADVYEYEAPEIKAGQRADVTLSYYPGRVYRGKVTYIYPQLDNATRTLKARVELPNPDFALKPDMYANVDLKIDYGKRLVVPQEAVMDSGAEALVFVAHEGGYFEPRKVTVGAKVDNTLIVLGGLKAGERVVTSANFLIDSESKLKSAAGGMGMPGHGGHDGAPAGGKPSPQTGPEDHSQHQQTQPPQAKPQEKTTDHSGHQPQGGRR
jgi:membrane fusion protein, copper/silver efflux system